MKNKTDIQKHCQHHFSTHKAVLIQDTDRYFAADYRRTDGSSNYYINFIVDKQNGSLIISGDLGNCISTWFDKVTPKELNRCIRNNCYYFVSKMQTSTDKYNYDPDVAYTEIVASLTEEGFEVPNEYKYLTEEEFFEELREEVQQSYCHNSYKVTEKLYDMMTAVSPDYIESFQFYGRSLDMRIHLWLYAFNEVCEQLLENA